MKINLNDKSTLSPRKIVRETIFANNLQPPYSKERIVNLSKINDININIGQSHVDVVAGISNDLVIRISGKVSYEPSYTEDIENGILNIKLNQNVHIGLAFSDLRMTVEIPSMYQHNLNINAALGYITINLLELNNIKLRTSKGNVLVEPVCCGSISIEVSNGDILTANITARKDFTAKTSVGNIKTGALTANNVEVTNRAGNINISGLTGKKASILCNRGATAINGIKNTNLNIKNSNGDIQIEYDIFNNNINLNCVVGSVNLSLPQDSQFSLKASVASGKIECGFAVSKTTSGRNSLKGTVGKKTANSIMLHTKSGRITIDSIPLIK